MTTNNDETDAPDDRVSSEWKFSANVPLIILTGILSVLLLVVAGLGTEAFFRFQEGMEREVKSEKAVPLALVELRKEQRDGLERDGWDSDKHEHRVIPIQSAMAMVVESKGRPPSLKVVQPATTTQPAPGATTQPVPDAK